MRKPYNPIFCAAPTSECMILALTPFGDSGVPALLAAIRAALSAIEKRRADAINEKRRDRCG